MARRRVGKAQKKVKKNKTGADTTTVNSNSTTPTPNSTTPTPADSTPTPTDSTSPTPADSTPTPTDSTTPTPADSTPTPTDSTTPTPANSTTPAPINSFNVTQLEKAVQALKAYYSNKAKESKQLFSKAESVQLSVALNQVPRKKSSRPTLVRLPYSIHGDSTEICLIVRTDHKKELLAAKQLPNVAKIYTPGDVKKKFPTFEAKRKLMASYDLFMCEKPIYDTLGRLFGKQFIAAKKYPIPIKIKLSPTPSYNIAAARDSTAIFPATGTSLSVKVGWSTMNDNELVQNVLAVLAKMKKNWSNILHFGIKGHDTPVLPVYAKSKF